MTKLSKLLFGQVTNRIHGRKVCFIHIDNHTQLITKVNSDIYHETSLGCYFFFKYNPNTLHIESIKSAREATATDLDVALKNLDSASTNLVTKMNLLRSVSVKKLCVLQVLFSVASGLLSKLSKASTHCLSGSL